MELPFRIQLLSFERLVSGRTRLFFGHSFHSEPKVIHENEKRLLESIGKKLGVTKLDDWLHIKKEDIVKNGGRSVLNRCGSSLLRMVCSVFLEHNWESSSLFRRPNVYWEEEKVRKEFMDSLGKKLGYSRMEDWYRVTNYRRMLSLILDICQIRTIVLEGGQIGSDREHYQLPILWK